MRNTYIAIAVIILALGGWYLYSSNTAPVATPQDAVKTDDTAATQTQPATDASVKEFTVSGKKFAFSPSTLSVKKGDHVKITFVNTEGFHDWVLDEFSARTKQINEGQTDVVEFVADKVGSFEYFCSVGQHRAMGMKGTLTVTE